MSEWTLVKNKKPPEGEVVYLTIQGHDVIVINPGETLADGYARAMNNRYVTEGYWCEEENGWNSMFGYPLMIAPIAWKPKEVPEPYEGEE